MIDLTEHNHGTDGPSVGDMISMAVVPSPTRTTIFPETSVVLTADSDRVEIAFLRREVALVSQQGQITRSSDGSIDVEMKDTSAIAQIHDVGHVRLAIPAAIDLVRMLVHHIADHHGRPIEEIIAVVAERK